MSMAESDLGGILQQYGNGVLGGEHGMNQTPPNICHHVGATFTRQKKSLLWHPIFVSLISHSLTNTVMAWRNQGITGSNNIPLGKRRMGADDEEEDSRTATPSFDGPKRGRSPVRGMYTSFSTSKTTYTHIFLP
jgi:hypothetical protein